jgi:regulatory protein
MSGMHAPRKVSTEAELHAIAMRALMRRAHSVHQMRVLLERRAAEENLVPPVMQGLKRSGYLDDARFALEFARSHARTRHQGKYRIARELRVRGVPDRHIESALESVFSEGDEAALLRARVEKWRKSLRGPMNQRQYASLYNNLMRAGFPPEAIRGELNRLRSQAAASRAGLDEADSEMELDAELESS